MEIAERIRGLEKEIKEIKEKILLSEKIVKMAEELRLLREKLNVPVYPIYPDYPDYPTYPYPGYPQQIWTTTGGSSDKITSTGDFLQGEVIY